MLRKQLLREQVLELIRRSIVDGTMVAGVTINERALAEQYGLSRTPVREALLALESEGFVTATANRGFSVNELCDRERQDLYALRVVLEPLALQLSGVPEASTLDELAMLNEMMKSPTIKREEMIDSDEAFHTRLIARCPNEMLLRMITGLRRQSRRYEFVLFRTVGEGLSTSQHDQIIASLRAGSLDDACGTLANNMTSRNPEEASKRLADHLAGSSIEWNAADPQ